MALELNPFNGIYGLPPSTHVSDDMIINSMPVFEITPCKPDFESGLNLFTIIDDTEAYTDMLRHHGFITPTPVKVAFIADNFPTDSFTNDYGETFLQKFTDVASQGMSQISQMMGAKDGLEGVVKAAELVKNVGGSLDGALGDIVQGAGSGAQNMASGLQNWINNNEAQEGIRGIIGGGADLINKMAAGHRVDFPQIWRNSGFTPSYTATVRLYNPNPASETSTKRYVVGPLAVLLSLALPRSKGLNTYSWPFFHKIVAKGIYNLDPAVITNITVVKGGDQQQIAYNQNLSMVDVRIDFTSLYNSILIEEGAERVTNRPTLRTYLDALTHNDVSISTDREQLRVRGRALSGTPNNDGAIRAQRRRTSVSIAQLDKNLKASKRIAPEAQSSSPTDRDDGKLQQQTSLIAQADPGFFGGVISDEA